MVSGYISECRRGVGFSGVRRLDSERDVLELGAKFFNGYEASRRSVPGSFHPFASRSKKIKENSAYHQPNHLRTASRRLGLAFDPDARQGCRMHSLDMLKLLQRVLAPPEPGSPSGPGEQSTSPKRAATVLDPDDDTGLGVALDEDLLKQLRFFFPDTLVLAAFDIVDRGGGG